MKLSKIILLAFISLALVVQPYFGIEKTWVRAAVSDDISKLNKEIQLRKETIKKLEKNIEGYKVQIKEKQTEAVSLRNQLSVIDNHVVRIQADIELTDEKIKKTELEINLINIEIKEKESVIERQKQIISKMLRDINKEQNKSYLELLLTNENISDFYNQLQYSETIYKDLGRSTKSLRLSKEDLESNKLLMEKYKKDKEDLKKQFENQKSDYEDQSNIKNDLLTKTKYSESRYGVLLNNLKSQYQQIENEISSYEKQIQKKLEEEKKIPATDGKISMAWPTASHYITSYFHDPDYPYRNVFEHSGIDIRASQGTPLTAAASGYVARARYCQSSSCYSYVLIVHTADLSTLYGHMSKIIVEADQYVHKGDIIGYSGGTPGTVGAGPFVTGPHLHFEVRLNGIPTNALNYLSN
ncbi:MAG: peptidoglycan DD-metalloendopeptidase family protein [bacterium]